MKITILSRRKGFAPVAMADIAFLLLIFLIVTVSVGDTPPVNLPIFKYARQTGFPKTAVISLTISGDVLLDGSPISADSLPSVLNGIAQPDELVITLHADAAVPYEKVDALLRNLQAGKYFRVVLMTEVPDAKK